MATEEIPERYRIVLLGDEGVGKTALLVRFLCHRYLGEYDPTIEDAYTKKIAVDGQVSILEVLDTAEKGLGTSRRHNYMKHANAIIFVYSTAELESFRSVLKYKGMAELYTIDRSVPFGLVGTKTDLSQKRQVSREEAQRLAHTFNWTFVECSSSTNDNVETIFHSLIRRLRNSRAMHVNVYKSVSLVTGEKIREGETKEKRKKSVLTRLSAQLNRTAFFSSLKPKSVYEVQQAQRERGETMVAPFPLTRMNRERRRSYSISTVL